MTNLSLWVFNCFAYDCKIYGPLAISILLGFSKYHTSEKLLKLQLYLPKIIFNIAKNKKAIESLISLDILTTILTFIFNNYYY